MSKNEKDDIEFDLQELEKILQSKDPDVFDGLADESKETILKTFASVTIHSHEGPLPPPSQLAEYEKIVSGLANRIMLSHEKSLDHNMKMSEKALDHDIDMGKGVLQTVKNGQLFGLILALIVLGVGFYLTMNGHSNVGGLLLGTTLVSLVGMFVKNIFFNNVKDSSKKSSKEDIEEAEIVED